MLNALKLLGELSISRAPSFLRNLELSWLI